VLVSTLPGFKGGFAPKNEVCPVRRGRGLRRESDKDATYLNVTPDRRDGTTLRAGSENLNRGISGVSA
jgi:hypothetical protein